MKNYPATCHVFAQEGFKGSFYTRLTRPGFGLHDRQISHDRVSDFTLPASLMSEIPKYNFRMTGNQ